MNKRDYLNLAMTMPIGWLQASAANPSKWMRPIHIKLALIAIRRKYRGMK